MNRREFLLGSALFVAGSSEIRAAESADVAGEISIIDTHQHLWTLNRFRQSWLKPGGELTRNFTMADYKAAIADTPIKKAIYMEVAVAPEHKLAEAEHIVTICRDNTNPTCAAVIGGMIQESGFKHAIWRFKGSPYIKGVRCGLYQARQLQDTQVIQNLRLLGELDMSFDLLVSPKSIGQAAQLVEQCGDTRFILDHCGNADPLAFHSNLDWGRMPQHDADQWRRGIEALARYANVICKISGIIARVPKDRATADVLAPIVEHCLEAFGPKRVVFGSDWPVCTRGASLREWVGLLNEIVQGRSAIEKHQLFWGNAHRFYRLL